MTKDALLQEINRFLEKLDITDLNQVYSYFKDLFSVNAESEERPVCPHCKSSLVIKHGFRHGKQCYRCKECKKTFVATKNTVTVQLLLYFYRYNIVLLTKYHTPPNLSKASGGMPNKARSSI